jgi:hypothetical protein
MTNPTSAASIRDTQEQLARIERELELISDPLLDLVIWSLVALSFAISCLFF